MRASRHRRRLPRVGSSHRTDTSGGSSRRMAEEGRVRAGANGNFAGPTTSCTSVRTHVPACQISGNQTSTRPQTAGTPMPAAEEEGLLDFSNTRARSPTWPGATGLPALAPPPLVGIRFRSEIDATLATLEPASTPKTTTTGVGDQRPITTAMITRLKRKPPGATPTIAIAFGQRTADRVLEHRLEGRHHLLAYFFSPRVLLLRRLIAAPFGRRARADRRQLQHQLIVAVLRLGAACGSGARRAPPWSRAPGNPTASFSKVAAIQDQDVGQDSPEDGWSNFSPWLLLLAEPTPARRSTAGESPLTTNSAASTAPNPSSRRNLHIITSATSLNVTARQDQHAVVHQRFIRRAEVSHGFSPQPARRPVSAEPELPPAEAEEPLLVRADLVDRRRGRSRPPRTS